jgi:hypothetical protein
MRSFRIYVDDVRCSRPSELTVVVASQARALEMAQEIMARSEHHVGVELCEHGRRLSGLGTLATRPLCRMRDVPCAAISPAAAPPDGRLELRSESVIRA